MRTCSIDGCERKHWARGLCGPHRKRLDSGQPLSEPIRSRRRESQSLESILNENASEDTDGGCLNWTGSVYRNGYGRISLDGRWKLAHRVVFEFHNGPIPDGAVVMHTCDRPVCVNPEHLSLGTMGDNSRDMAAKGRAGKPALRLSDAEVAEIRAASGLQREIAAQFGISQSYVSALRLGKKRAC